MVLALFTLAFVIGPALFLALDRRPARHGLVALAASVLVVVSFALRTDAGVRLTSDPLATLLSVLFIWIAWVLLMVLVAQALRTRFPSRRAGRVVRAVGAMGTTVPWFGFAAAQMMAR